ncbi:MAG: AAA family ATPase [Saprospiraceae bacterium]
MPNLKGIGLQNFRTFKDYEYLEFAPITLITGANNSGKSSIFKAIMLLKENFKDRNLNYRLDFESMKHELGNLDRIINRNTYKNLQENRKDEGKWDFREIINSKKEPENPLEDLVFTLPIEVGGKLKIKGRLELIYEVNISKNHSNLSLKSIDFQVKDDKEYLTIYTKHNFDKNGGYDEPYYWHYDIILKLANLMTILIDKEYNEIETIPLTEENEELLTLGIYERLEKGIPLLLDFFYSRGSSDDLLNLIEDYKTKIKGFSKWSHNQQEIFTYLSKNFKNLINNGFSENLIEKPTVIDGRLRSSFRDTIHWLKIK